MPLDKSQFCLGSNYFQQSKEEPYKEEPYLSLISSFSVHAYAYAYADD